MLKEFFKIGLIVIVSIGALMIIADWWRIYLVWGYTPISIWTIILLGIGWWFWKKSKEIDGNVRGAR